MRRGLLGTTALALAFSGAPLAAQQAAAEAENDEIIVTAQKREQRLQDVPISISVVSGGALESQGINRFIDFQSRVPNLSITDTPANASIFIRGIGTSGNTLSFEQSVALFIDGIYGGRNRQFMAPFFDVERVEVLRGPQGALFGRNTSAGAISLTTRRPTREFEGTAVVDHEFVRGSSSVELAASGPVSDKLAVRFAVRYGKNYGWLDNVVLDRKEPTRDDILARASLLWEPAETVKVFAKIEYGYSDVVGAPFEFVPFGTRPDYTIDTDDGLAPLRDFSNTLNGIVQADIEIGTHTLTSITGYSSFTYDQAFNIQARRPARLVTVNAERFEQISQEIRLASPADKPVNYILGGYLEHGTSNVERVSLLDLPPLPVLNQSNDRLFDQTTDVAALFGQLNWSPVEQLTVSGGLRWTQIDKEGDTRGTLNTFLPNGTTTAVPRVPLQGKFRETDWSPSANVMWRPSDNASLYVSYARGSKGGALVESANNIRDFLLDPEIAKSLEAGARLVFPSVRGFFNITAFTTDYSNLQKSTLNVADATFVTSNAAGARARGIELEGGFRPFTALQVTFAAAYLDTRYTDYPNGPCAFPNHTVPNCVEDRAGDRLQNAPEFTGNIGLNYDQPISDKLRLGANWFTNFQSTVNFQDVLNPLEEQPAFSKTDIRASIGDIDRKWEVAFLVRNLFDKRTSGIIFNTFNIGVGPNDRVHMPDPRRSFTIQARARF